MKPDNMQDRSPDSLTPMENLTEFVIPGAVIFAIMIGMVVLAFIKAPPC